MDTPMVWLKQRGGMCACMYTHLCWDYEGELGGVVWWEATLEN
jgi:hypothetical protein